MRIQGRIGRIMPANANPSERNTPMKENGKRFIQTHAQQDGLANRTYVLVDRETGVNYLLAGFLASSGVNCTGMTILVDSCGNPIVTPVGKNE